jgi:hypothetical protein
VKTLHSQEQWFRDCEALQVFHVEHSIDFFGTHRLGETIGRCGPALRSYKKMWQRSNVPRGTFEPFTQ